MKDVQNALDRLTPEPTRSSEWDAVLRDARPRRRSLALQLALATGVAALAALFVAAPWQGGERVGILDRALAAVGDGPVLHVVFRGGWGGTRVDLATGERQPVYGEREVWFDPSRNLVHLISRAGGVVENETLYKRNEGDRPDELTALWRNYRAALERGTARVIGEDVVDGVPVYWIIVRALMLPDIADGKKFEFAQQVAISRETFKPVAMRYTRDREVREEGTERILRFETVSVDEADFTADPSLSPDGLAFSQETKPLGRIAEAAEVLGRTPFWLGPEFGGLPLAQAAKEFSATGRSEKTLITGRRAEEIRRCIDLMRDNPKRRACRRRLHGIMVLNDKVYEVGRMQFGPQHTGLSFFYGTLGDNPTTFKKDTARLYSKPHVTVTQTTDREVNTFGPRFKYLPPEGSVVLVPATSGYLVHDGVYVTITASSEDLVLQAARALRPMTSASAGSGAGG